MFNLMINIDIIGRYLTGLNFAPILVTIQTRSCVMLYSYTTVKSILDIG